MNVWEGRHNNTFKLSALITQRNEIEPSENFQFIPSCSYNIIEFERFFSHLTSPIPRNFRNDKRQKRTKWHSQCSKKEERNKNTFYKHTHTYSTNRSRRSINKMKRENSFPGLIQKAGGEGALFAKSKGTANGTL